MYIIYCLGAAKFRYFRKWFYFVIIIVKSFYARRYSFYCSQKYYLRFGFNTNTLTRFRHGLYVSLLLTNKPFERRTTMERERKIEKFAYLPLVIRNRIAQKPRVATNLIFINASKYEYWILKIRYYHRKVISTIVGCVLYWALKYTVKFSFRPGAIFQTLNRLCLKTHFFFI